MTKYGDARFLFDGDDIQTGPGTQVMASIYSHPHRFDRLL